jgi:phosphatidylglycerophosphatase A
MQSTTEPARSAARKTPWAWAVATCLGIGYARPGPGTWASVAAVLLWLAASTKVHFQYLLVDTAAAALVAVVVGIPAATIVARESGGKDPQHVVIDEAAGQWIALLAASTPGRATWPHALACLALFRLFDITKPPPARQLERLADGTGIVLDDVAAGIYALAVALVAFHWW